MNRKLLTHLILFIAFLLLIVPVFSYTVHSIPPVNQTTIIVDINGNGDYTSIRDAINSATSTNIIEIKEGVYRENNLETSKKLTIVGESPSSTIIDFSGEKGFILSSSHVDISNLKLTNAGDYAIYVPPENDGCTISNCIIDKYGSGVGISIEASSVIVTNCNVSGYNSTAIGIRVARQHGNIIKGCTIQGFDTGVLIQLNSYDNKIVNSNIVNNQIGIDIRINSHDNTVSDCNVYSNSKGLYVWQSSNKNLIYRNNFWKNDVNAVDESNNSWYNGEQGNYWNDYQGVDANRDGIGDTPYIISSKNKDEYPIMTLIIPDVITLPTNIKQTTSVSDETPSFTWAPSVYSKTIKGYYIKIDKNSEIFIGNTTSWASSNKISNGVHVFYIRAESVDGTSSNYATLVFSIDTSVIDSDNDGWSDEEELKYGTDPNDVDNHPLDTDGDFIPNSADTDDDNDGYSDDMEMSYRSNPLDPNSHPTDTDHDGIPDDDSYDGKYAGDTDDDNDGLTDVEEMRIGSNSKYGLDVKKVYLDGRLYYLVDTTQDGTFDILYNQISETTTAVEKNGEIYLIDQNGDGAWDYTYDTTSGSISTYGEKLQIPYMWIILIVVVFTIISAIVWYYSKNIKSKLKYPKQREYIEYEKPKRPVKLPAISKPLPKIPASDRRYTLEMMNETRILLQKIEQNFAEYVEKLSQIDEQIEENYPELEHEKARQEEAHLETEKSETKNTEDVESEVDRLLSDLSKK